MAVIVTELSGIGGGLPGETQAAPIVNGMSVVAQQSLTIGGAASSAFGASTSYIEIDSDTACRVEMGDAPDGSGFSFYVPALMPRWFGVRRGAKIIAVAAS